MIAKITGNSEVANTYLICRYDGCFLIDPSSNFDLINQKLEAKSLLGIILTHAHSDHVNLIAKFNVPIYLHQNDMELLFLDKYNGYLNSSCRPYQKKGLELINLADNDKIKLGDKFIQIIHTPGHTSGSVCIYYDNALFTGDTLFKEDVGRHDLYSGNLSDLKRSIVKIINLFSDDTKIYPGHDENSTIRHERKNNEFYIKWSKQTKK